MTSNPAVTFLLTDVQPPSRVYIGRDDQIVLRVSTISQSRSFSFSYRLLRADGVIVPFEDDLALGPNNVLQKTYQLAEGYLLSCSITCTDGLQNPNAYASVRILRSNLPSVSVFAETLIAGWLIQQTTLSYPESVPSRSTDGRGFIRSVTGSTPAAGADISEAVPSNAIWRLIAFRAQFVASAAVATRQVAFTFDDGANIWNREALNLGITAGQGATFQLYSNPNTNSDFGLNFFLWLSDQTYMFGGFRIRTSTNAIQAGDQWSAIQYLVEEWVIG